MRGLAARCLTVAGGGEGHVALFTAVIVIALGKEWCWDPLTPLASQVPSTVKRAIDHHRKPWTTGLGAHAGSLRVEALMPKSWLVSDIKLLTRDEWPMLRDIRLNALQTRRNRSCQPMSARSCGEEQWQPEFARGEWNIGLLGTEPVSPPRCHSRGQDDSRSVLPEYQRVAPKSGDPALPCARSPRPPRSAAARGVRTGISVLDGMNQPHACIRAPGCQHESPPALPANPPEANNRSQLTLA
jgi:hypothetical protein